MYEVERAEFALALSGVDGDKRSMRNSTVTYMVRDEFRRRWVPNAQGTNGTGTTPNPFDYV